jgi:biopolymer transport protein ExbD
MSVCLDHGEDSLDVVHEINVTPLIDVILVLLIIFMIAAPLATVDVAVNLPTSNVDPRPRPDQPIFPTIKSDLTLWPGVPRCRAQASRARSMPFQRATATNLCPCGPTSPLCSLMENMNLLRSAGYAKVALVGLDAEASR